MQLEAKAKARDCLSSMEVSSRSRPVAEEPQYLGSVVSLRRSLYTQW